MAISAHIADKAGVIGTLLGSFGCAACFPAAATIGAAVGLGFLVRWEGLLVRFLIPACAIVVLTATWAGWRSHRQWLRAITGSLGPVMALLGAFGLMGVFGMTHGFLPANIARATFYAGLVVMLLSALWDLIRPANPRCGTARAGTSVENG